MKLNDVSRVQPVLSTNCRSPPINGRSRLMANAHCGFTAASFKVWRSGTGTFIRQARAGRWAELARYTRTQHDTWDGGLAERYKEHEHGEMEDLLKRRLLVRASQRVVLHILIEGVGAGHSGIHAPCCSGVLAFRIGEF